MNIKTILNLLILCALLTAFTNISSSDTDITMLQKPQKETPNLTHDTDPVQQKHIHASTTEKIEENVYTTTHASGESTTIDTASPEDTIVGTLYGSQIAFNSDDESRYESFSDGRHSAHYADGSESWIYPNGSYHIRLSDGTQALHRQDGSIFQMQADVQEQI